MLRQVRDGVVVFDGREAPAEVNRVLCVVPDCANARGPLGLCGMHYQRKRRAVDGAPPRGPKPTALTAEEKELFSAIERARNRPALTDEDAEKLGRIAAVRGEVYASKLKPWQFDNEILMLGKAGATE